VHVTALAVIFGILIVLTIALDIGLAVLHPTIQGPMSHRITRLIWHAVRRLAITVHAPRVLTFAGPLATLGLLFWWLVGLWIGFALIYLPFLPHFAAADHLTHKGFFDALYISATMLTTLGLGDIAPTHSAMRAAVGCEAVAGVGTVTAAISYVLSVYPLATQTRAHARYLSDLQLHEPPAAVEYLSAAGDSGIAEIHQRLIDGHQSLRRFPVLYYFHPDQEAESIKRLLESASVLCAVACWAPPEGFSPYGHRLAEALRATLGRIARDYQARYIGGASGQSAAAGDGHDAGRVVGTLRRYRGVSEADHEHPQTLAHVSEFVTEMSNLIAGLASAHLYPHRPLFDEPAFSTVDGDGAGARAPRLKRR
jgi:hypothetical protein